MLWQHVVTSGRGTSRLTAFSVPKETLRWALQFVGRGGGASAPAGDEAAAQPQEPVNIYESGTGRWLHLPDWPRTSSATWLLGPGRSLVAAGGAETGAGRDEVAVRLQDKPGGWSRWKGMLNVGKMVRYSRLRRLPLRYVASTPQAAPLRLCGSPVVTVFMDTSDGSGDVFAYLLDVDPAGKCHYITEGCLRLQHRHMTDDPAAMGPRLHSMLPQAAPSLPMRTFLRADACGAMPKPGEAPAQVAFALMPVSYVLARGHRLGLTLTGSDDTHFDPLPGTRVMGVSYGGGAPSRVDLPVLQ
jgi:putative CocE/NonD family hydrolase